MVDSKYFSTLVFALIFSTVAVSLYLLLGLTGLLSLGQTALFAVGAYTSAILTKDHGVRPDVAMCIAVLAAVVVAMATSPILRLKGFYFALATLALVLIVQDVLTNWIGVTGGASGFVGIGKFTFVGIELQSQRSYYLFAYVVLLLAVVIALHLSLSRFGRSLIAIREDATAAEALGISVYWAKVRVWAVAAGLASLAGVVYAHYVQFVSPSQFGLEPTINVLAATVVGGLGAVFGPIIGVIVLWMLPALFTELKEYSTLAWGLMLMGFMIFAPAGIYGVTASRLARRRRTDAAPRPDGSDHEEKGA
jgi:branched-chain amino acid transport system permease protein